MKKCFIICPFGDPFDDYCKEIYVKSIQAAGLEAFRADDIYGVRPIMQDIWDSIRDADIILADLTTKNSNVFYELGIAHSYQKPVILLSKTMDDVPFDLKHYRVLVYDTASVYWADELRNKISLTIEHLLNESDSSNELYFKIDTENNLNQNWGITKFTHTAIDRISDYKTCLADANGDCFVSGTSMIHISEDSADLILEKIRFCKFRFLIMDPDWIKTHYEILTFLNSVERRRKFYIEIENSLGKFNELYDDLPEADKKNIEIKTYKTFFPYIITGYNSEQNGKMVVEITDHLAEKNRPRLTISKLEGDDNPFVYIISKFNSLWNNHKITKGIIP